MSASLLDHPLFAPLLGDPEIAGQFTLAAEFDGFVTFETALAQAEAECGLIPGDAAEAIATAMAGFVPDTDALAARVTEDGLAGPGWVAQARAAVPQDHRAHFHFGGTSQDLIDTGQAIRLKPICAALVGRIAALGTQLADLESRFGGHRLMARTRMQDALEMSAGVRIAAWREPLLRHLSALDRILPDILRVHLGGPVGDRAALGDHADAVTAAMAKRLGLAAGQGVWNAQRDALHGFAAVLAGVSGTLGKFGQDVALMALAGREQITLASGGGSSAMPHKSNPVLAEILVSLARANAGLAGTMAQALVHEQERSGAAWTLEWLVLPQIVRTTGAGLLVAARLAEGIEAIGVAPSRF